jgi:hypothetical protein
MPNSVARRRVMIAVSPPLLGELIARRLDPDALDVVVQPATSDRPATTDRPVSEVDVFVTTVPPSPEVHAYAVLLLTTTESGPDAGTECAVHTATTEARIPLHEMADLVALIDTLASHHEIHQS